MTEPPVVLALRQVTRRRGTGPDGFTLEIPSFTVRRGEFVALTGPSGCGKSTLLDLLGIVLKPHGAETFLLHGRSGEAVDVAALWRDNRSAAMAAVRAESIGYVLQTGGLLPFLPARDNIVLSRRLLGMKEDGLVEHLVERLRIGHLLAKKPRALSIGERQRVAIARALAHRPALLLADEPTAALDPAHAVEVTELLLELIAGLDSTAIIVSHDWDLVRSLGLREIHAIPMRRGSASATRFEG
ncbi:MAG: ATP-binding cassette domain-containing protein [Rhodospirillales bacterium]|nr:ATP-binding cassette domain-containing protein [Rhodospirillales bacterium]